MGDEHFITYEKLKSVFLKNILENIAGRKIPALVDPWYSTSGPLPIHLGPIDGHMVSHNSILQKRLISQNLRTGKKVTSKDPFRVYARDK